MGIKRMHTSENFLPLSLKHHLCMLLTFWVLQAVGQSACAAGGGHFPVLFHFLSQYLNTTACDHRKLSLRGLIAAYAQLRVKQGLKWFRRHQAKVHKGPQCLLIPCLSFPTPHAPIPETGLWSSLLSSALLSVSVTVVPSQKLQPTRFWDWQVQSRRCTGTVWEHLHELSQGHLVEFSHCSNFSAIGQ